ncbi:MAG TPA: enoyl-CoA hydratase/isomerase family protein [Steroidobacteraceae bacterium]|nr:enoyl-CoA hydratase/isomerase family protein [Steroidobacteraceae bacterium]
MTDSPVLADQEDELVILTLNAPARRNAISTQMRSALRDAVRTALKNDSCRAIVLTGAGAAFSSGADVDQMQSGASADLDQVRMRYSILHDTVKLMCAGPKPFVAAVEGFAMGAGLSLASACDVMIVSRTAKLVSGFGKMGLIGDCGLLWTMPQRVGIAKTKDFLFSGRSLSGAEAFEMGFADYVVESGEALTAAKTRARTYATAAPLTVAETKTLLNGTYSSLEAFLAAESAMQDRMCQTADHDEARRAFAQKRPPRFIGR